jgi:hypothetical protein
METTTRKFIAVLFTIISTVVLYLTVSNSVENQARFQNNLNLNNTVYCTDMYLKETGYSTENFTRALNTCAKNIRSLGVTSDQFVIRQEDKKLFWDSSVDCKPKSNLKLYMTKEGVCSLFRKPNTCIKATRIMIENPPKGDLTWVFDDSPEYLDYLYFPRKIDNKTYIIGQGSQQDEANSQFIRVYIVLLISALLIVSLLVF